MPAAWARRVMKYSTPLHLVERAEIQRRVVELFRLDAPQMAGARLEQSKVGKIARRCRLDGRQVGQERVQQRGAFVQIGHIREITLAPEDAARAGELALQHGE